MSDSLFDFFNKSIHDLRVGDLVLINTIKLKAKYDIASLKDSCCIGILLSDGISADELSEGEISLNRSPRIYYKKMYKVYSCCKIIIVEQSDVKERLNR